MSAETLTQYVRARAPYFWQNVNVTSTTACWLYLGHTDDRGYGRFSEVLAHRFAWMAHHGKALPASKVIRHRCDNPPCVNPAHLIAGTQYQNMQDAVARTFAYACKNGHPRTPETTGLTRNGHRRCLVCDRQQQRARRARAKEMSDVQ